MNTPSREIKFRIAYRSPFTDEPNKWLISEPLTPHDMMFSDDTQVDFIGGGYLRYDEMNDGTDEVVFEQFTGLVDKNGNEIYEGDIVSTPSDTVDFDGNRFRYWTAVQWETNRDLLVSGFHLGDDRWGTDIEVVGNVYQNPELVSEPRA